MDKSLLGVCRSTNSSTTTTIYSSKGCSDINFRSFTWTHHHVLQHHTPPLRMVHPPTKTPAVTGGTPNLKTRIAVSGGSKNILSHVPLLTTPRTGSSGPRGGPRLPRSKGVPGQPGEQRMVADQGTSRPPGNSGTRSLPVTKEESVFR